MEKDGVALELRWHKYFDFWIHLDVSDNDEILLRVLEHCYDLHVDRDAEQPGDTDYLPSILQVGLADGEEDQGDC